MSFVKYEEKTKIPSIQTLFQTAEMLLPSRGPWELLLLINHRGKDQLQPVTLIEKITVHFTKASFFFLKKF